MTDDTTDDSDATERIERTDTGASVRAELTRGTGTRDQDKVRIKAKGQTADETAERFEALLARYEDDWSDRLRAIDPEETDADG